MDMQAILAAQKAAHLRDGAPSAELRIDRIDRCIRLLVENRRAIEDALDADFGARSKDATAFTDVAGSIGPLKHAKAHLTQWMRPETRKTTPASVMRSPSAPACRLRIAPNWSILRPAPSARSSMWPSHSSLV